jgi:hypothetical protein
MCFSLIRISSNGPGIQFPGPSAKDQNHYTHSRTRPAKTEEVCTRRRTRDPGPGSPPHQRRRTRDPCPGISAALEEQDPGSMPWISATSEEEDPGSMYRICNSAKTEDEGGGLGFHTRDLQPVPWSQRAQVKRQWKETERSVVVLTEWFDPIFYYIYSTIALTDLYYFI